MSTRSLFHRFALVASLLTGTAVVVAPVSQAHAQVPAVKKIAMVDMQRVLNDTVAGKRARKKLEARSKTAQSKIDKKRKKLEADALKAQSLKGAALQAAEEQLQREAMEMQQMAATLEGELGEQHNKLLEKMYTNAQKLVATMAKAQGIDLVLIRDQMTVIFAKDTLDITGAIIKKYNALHK